LNRINLERDNQLIVDFCASTNEQEALALCKNNGIVQIVTNLLDKQPKIVSKPVEAFCGKLSLIYEIFIYLFYDPFHFSSLLESKRKAAGMLFSQQQTQLIRP
jgi:hypothetical protein